MRQCAINLVVRAMARRILECGIHGLRRLSQSAVALGAYVYFLVGCLDEWGRRCLLDRDGEEAK